MKVLPFSYQRKQPVIEIGCRHTTEHRIYNDRDTGDYQELNPIIDGHMALIQKVLCPALHSTKLTSESQRSLLSAQHAHVAKLVALSRTPTGESCLPGITVSPTDNLTVLTLRVKQR